MVHPNLLQEDISLNKSGWHSLLSKQLMSPKNLLRFRCKKSKMCVLIYSRQECTHSMTISLKGIHCSNFSGMIHVFDVLFKNEKIPTRKSIGIVQFFFRALLLIKTKTRQSFCICIRNRSTFLITITS